MFRLLQGGRLALGLFFFFFFVLGLFQSSEISFHHELLYGEGDPKTNMNIFTATRLQNFDKKTNV